jgi:tRNA G46 methylase TrmB
MDWATYYPAYAEPKITDSSESTTIQTEDSSSEAIKPQNGSDGNGANYSDTVPTKAKDMRKLRQDVEVADIGCGFGGLLVALAPKLPNTLMLGIAASR